MSRASAGTFAAFFPNAPSVLQQKRKRASHGRQNAKSSGQVSCADDINSKRLEDGSKLQDRIYGYRSGHATNPSPPSDEEAQKSVSGDTSAGVGSDSSLASTVSSVFSNVQPPHGAIAALTSDSHSLTPITNTESSPLRKTTSPSNNKYITERSYGNPSRDWRNQPSGPDNVVNVVQPTSEKRTQARPGPGQAKGFKVLYDPELDPKLSGKDRKRHKVRYRNFGEEVRPSC